MKRVYKEIKPELVLEGSITPIKEGDIVVIHRRDKSKLVLKAVTGMCTKDCMFRSESTACPYVQSVRRSMIGSNGKVNKTWRESCNISLCIDKHTTVPGTGIVFKNVDDIMENL